MITELQKSIYEQKFEFIGNKERERERLLLSHPISQRVRDAETEEEDGEEEEEKARRGGSSSADHSNADLFRD